HVMAINAASMALRTEAQPFTPQAQGTRARPPDHSRDSPSGNGIPMKKASGAIRPSEARILGMSPRDRSESNRVGRIRRERSDTAMIPMTESWIAEIGGPRPGVGRWQAAMGTAHHTEVAAATA